MPRYTPDDIGDADRRSVLKFIGVGGTVAAGTGLGLLSLTGSAAAATVEITSSNPDAVESDSGEVDNVYIEPSLEVAWDGFDDVVGKVRVLVEAATGASDADPSSLDYMPVFRATGYANGTDNDVETETGPGTSGSFGLDWFANDNHVVLYGDDGAPDYENGNYNCGATMESYLNGTLMGDPIDSASNGFYGPAGSAAAVNAPEDGSSSTTTIFLRYTVSLHKPDISFVEEDGYDLDGDEVRPFSPLVMAGGEDGYPDLSDPQYGTAVTTAEADMYDGLSEGDVVPATALPYSMLQDNAAEHPAIMMAYTQFDVSIENQPADAGVTGESNPGVTVGDEVGMLPDDGSSGNETSDNGTE